MAEAPRQVPEVQAAATPQQHAKYPWPQPARLLGTRVTRVDAPLKVSGRARYSYDIVRPGMIYGRILRSPHAHARVTSLDWKSYPILTFPDVPDVVMDLIDRPNERPWGAGEPAAAVVPSAVANAIYDAVGGRMRSVPFTPDKVLAALKSA